MKRTFDLVVLDLDGTIINPYKREAISPVVLEAIAAVQAIGVGVTIGTGRTLDYIRHQMPSALHLTHPVLVTQGAVIGDPVTGHVLAEQDLPLDAARALIAWVDASQHPTALYFLDDDDRTHVYENMIGKTPEEQETLNHLLGYPFTFVEHFGHLLSGEHAHPPIKSITLNDPEAGNDLLPEILRRFTPALSITRTHPWLIEATGPGVDKGSGLRKLCEILGISPERVLAIGDSDNDIPLLQAAGFAVAMGNATPGVKAVADWIAPTIDEDGAAVAMRRWVMDV
ncbi:MAG: HAD family hydrolase [Anaerolineales bacterium]|nr:HAD family hydrolase [Anaerolineales bacterium]